MLEDYGLITGLGPSGGWTFQQPFAGKEVPLSAQDAIGLVRAIILFRINQKIEIGDVEYEVAEHIKKASPQNERFKGKHYEPNPNKFVPFFERARLWIASLQKSRPQLVREGIAKERAAICAGCPQNVKWQTECEPCNESVVYEGRALRQHAAFEYDGQLRFCRLHGLLLEAAVFMDESDLPKRDEQAPTPCWLT